MTRVPFNMAYGPWNGSAWWQKVRASAMELIATEKTSGALFQTFYPRMCLDEGTAPIGTKKHMEDALAAIEHSPCVVKKGRTCGTPTMVQLVAKC